MDSVEPPSQDSVIWIEKQFGRDDGVLLYSQVVRLLRFGLKNVA